VAVRRFAHPDAVTRQPDFLFAYAASTRRDQQSAVDFAIGHLRDRSRRGASYRVSLESLFCSSGEPKIIQAESTDPIKWSCLTNRASRLRDSAWRFSNAVAPERLHSSFGGCTDMMADSGQTPANVCPACSAALSQDWGVNGITGGGIWSGASPEGPISGSALEITCAKCNTRLVCFARDEEVAAGQLRWEEIPE
jgi:hypothetical protein